MRIGLGQPVVAGSHYAQELEIGEQTNSGGAAAPARNSAAGAKGPCIHADETDGESRPSAV